MPETCGYYYGTLDVNDEDHLVTIECEQDKDHIGPHAMNIEWDTRPEDICALLDHDWGRWRKIPEPKPVAVHEATGLSTALVADLIFPAAPGEWETEPTKERRCKRCKRHETDGVWERSAASDVFVIYGRDAFPTLRG